MEISFKDKNLNKMCNDNLKCRRKFGYLRASILIRRLNMLKDAVTLEDVKYLPGRFHELTGSRKGQWACDDK